MSEKPQKHHSKSSLGFFQNQYLIKLLVNMYSYLLVVKAYYVAPVAVMCMEADFSNPVKNNYYGYMIKYLQYLVFRYILSFTWLQPFKMCIFSHG